MLWRFLLIGCVFGSAGVACGAEPAKIDGRELFTREWLPKDSRSAAGDGLGPVFNDTSCVACHNQGGIGGGGTNSKNAQLISIFRNAAPEVQSAGIVETIVFGLVTGRAPHAKPKPMETPKDEATLLKAEREKLAKIHPGFLTARSVVLHRSSTDAGYAEFRDQLIGIHQFGFSDPFGHTEELDSSQEALSNEQKHARGVRRAEAIGDIFLANQGTIRDEFTIITSQRNTPPLFGAGLIDAIGDDVLQAASERKFEEFPEVTGRVAKMKDGRSGRFGWKAQHAKLNDFVLTACAVELGLEVPTKPQLGLPQKPDYVAPGLDLKQEECDALTDFVAKLPRPTERRAANDGEKEYLAAGAKLFESTGCATCHQPKLGEVSGIYSDLLLHDMGESLGDSAGYSGFVPNGSEEEELQKPVPPLVSTPNKKQPKIDESKLVGATRREWRTPPLWGLRDSAPYLHDGRASHLEQAIALHSGEAARSSQRFFKLSGEEQLRLTLFLKSLQAP